MAEFDFGNLGSLETETSNLYLKPWNVYENVKFDGVEGPKSGTSVNGTSWEAYDLKFSCPDGKFTHKMFTPVEGKSNVRPKFKNKEGHEVEGPSEFEKDKYLLAQIGATFNKEGWIKLTDKLAKTKGITFKILMEGFSKLIGTPETTTKMKLVGKTNSKGGTMASVPNIVRIDSKTGRVYVSDNFVGDKVALSAWELGKKAEYEKAKPTSISENKSDNFNLSEEKESELEMSDSEVNDLLDQWND